MFHQAALTALQEVLIINYLLLTIPFLWLRTEVQSQVLSTKRGNQCTTPCLLEAGEVMAGEKDLEVSSK